MSSKHLTTLKASYLKLLFLLEKGVKFVGHGLKKDFRVINILVCTPHTSNPHCTAPLLIGITLLTPPLYASSLNTPHFTRPSLYRPIFTPLTARPFFIHPSHSISLTLLLQVPPEQVVDTVELFHCPKQRFVSLKFLAWFYTGTLAPRPFHLWYTTMKTSRLKIPQLTTLHLPLCILLPPPPGIRIQEGAHDSAEDARMALLLYRKYQELEACNSVAKSLQQLYETGRGCGWQIPDS